ncbi:MAG: hypothetical protein AAGF33_04095 [Pseudomonadota bacterium]
MSRKSPRWALDMGYTSDIKAFRSKTSLADHGLKGEKANGNLSFSRMMTRKQAKADARDGIPVSEAMTRDQWSEREQLFTEEADDIRRGVDTWFKTTGGDVRNFVLEMTPADIEPDQLEEAIKSEESELRHFETDDMKEAKTSHESSIVELDAFRERHKGRIGERTPDIKKNVEQTLAILLFILIVEGCFNALLFKDAQSSGLLGGMLIAFGISAVNVACGVSAGFFGLRNLNHHEQPMKILGGVVAGLFILMGLFVNFFVAHFRDAVEESLLAAQASGSLAGFSMFNIPPGEVIRSMFPNIFGLESLVAYALLFIGLAVFGIGVYEGYDRISDKYPGYGRVWRKERKAYERRQAVRNELRDDLSNYFTQCRAWFDTQQSRHVAAKREIEKAMTELETRRERALAISSRCADQERGLKIAYRQAHRRERNGLRDKLGEQAECPAYFDEIVTPNLPTFEYEKERELAAVAVKTIEQNITALTLTRKWLETHIQGVQKGLSSIEQRVGAHIENIRKERQTGKEPERAKSA